MGGFLVIFKVNMNITCTQLVGLRSLVSRILFTASSPIAFVRAHSEGDSLLTHAADIYKTKDVILVNVDVKYL